ncbi:MAG TPA: hypothetical protein VLT47_11255 [Anaeromyxobacteraceae bacterium]|nr:hypothetical protein [Anaeromyxobacteraceae bacterium]
MEHAINRTEYQRSGGAIRCAIVCECGTTTIGRSWREAGEMYDGHLAAEAAAGGTVDYNPRDMDGDPLTAWHEWGVAVGAVPGGPRCLGPGCTLEPHHPGPCR